VERLALEFLLVFIFIVFVIGRPIFKHALLLFAPPDELSLDCTYVHRTERHGHVHKLGFIELARRFWLDRTRHVRRRRAFRR